MLDFDQGRVEFCLYFRPGFFYPKRKTVDLKLEKRTVWRKECDQQARRQVVDAACTQALIRRLKAAVFAVVVVRNQAWQRDLCAIAGALQKWRAAAGQLLVAISCRMATHAVVTGLPINLARQI